MNILRWLLIAACNSLPSKLGRVAIALCYRLPAYPEEAGCFRTDVALCALGLLRQGDIKTFERWIARYPFAERWNGFFHPRLLKVSHQDGIGWRINSITHSPGHFGMAVIPLKAQR